MTVLSSFYIFDVIKHNYWYSLRNYNVKVKRDHRSKFSNLSNWKEEA